MMEATGPKHGFLRTWMCHVWAQLHIHVIPVGTPEAVTRRAQFDPTPFLKGAHADDLYCRKLHILLTPFLVFSPTYHNTSGNLFVWPRQSVSAEMTARNSGLPNSGSRGSGQGAQAPSRPLSRLSMVDQAHPCPTPNTLSRLLAGIRTLAIDVLAILKTIWSKASGSPYTRRGCARAQSLAHAISSKLREVLTTQWDLISKILILLTIFIAGLTLWPTFAGVRHGREANLLAQWTAQKSTLCSANQ